MNLARIFSSRGWQTEPVAIMRVTEPVEITFEDTDPATVWTAGEGQYPLFVLFDIIEAFDGGRQFAPVSQDGGYINSDGNYLVPAAVGKTTMAVDSTYSNDPIESILLDPFAGSPTVGRMLVRVLYTEIDS